LLSKASYTRAFYYAIISALQKVQVQQTVANLFKTSRYTVRVIMNKAVEIGLENRLPVKLLTSISIDEKAFERGHNYATIMIDNNSNTVLDLVEGRDKANTKALFNLITNREKFPELQQVNIDMWKSYIEVVKEIAPNAKIIHDNFHLVSMLSKAIDITRRKEVKKNPILKKTKYNMLKNEDNRTETQKTIFQKIDSENLQTAQAWYIRENFKSIKKVDGYNTIYATYMEWIDSAIESKISAVIKVVETFERHREGIMNGFICKTSSAKHENKNGMIQSILAKARGFLNFERFRINVLFYFGNLDFSL
jgi:transposase